MGGVHGGAEGDVRKVKVPRLFWSAWGEITIALKDGSDFTLGLWERQESHAKALAKIVGAKR